MPINTNPNNTGLNLQSKPVGYMKRLRYDRTISKRTIAGDVKSSDLTAAKISAIQTDSSLTDVQVIRPTSAEKSVAINPVSPSQDISIGALENIPKDLRGAGINPLRAELISVFQFFPKSVVTSNVTMRGSLLFDFINLRFFERELSRTNVTLAIEAIKKELPDVYEQQEKGYKIYYRVAENRLRALETILATIEKAATSLDFKKSIKSDPETESFMQGVFINVLGFSEAGFDIFSSSKLFQQLLNDFLWMLQNYAPGMFGLESQTRRGDLNPVSLNHDFVPANKFISFSVKTLSAKASNPIDWSKPADYTQRFLSTLPAQTNDQIKILILAVSRELTVSAGIGFYSAPGVISWLGTAWHGAQRRAATQVGAGGDPFLNLVGNVGERVDTPKAPVGSLAMHTRFVKVMNGQSRVVLPFESREFLIPGGESIAPGAFAFIDNPMAGSADIGAGKFVLGTFVDFADRFYRDAKAVTNYCERLVGIRGISPRHKKSWGHEGFLGASEGSQESVTFGSRWNDILRPDEMYKGLLQIVDTAAEGLLGASSTIDEGHLFQCALINLAAEDEDLRYELFRFLIEYAQQIAAWNRPGPSRDMSSYNRLTRTMAARILNVIGNSEPATVSPMFAVDVKPSSLHDRISDTMNWAETIGGAGVFGMLVGYVDELMELAEVRADGAVDEAEAKKSGQGAFTNAGTLEAESKYNSVSYEGIFAMVFEAFVLIFSSHVKCSIHLKNPGATGRSSNLTSIINFPSVIPGFNAGGFSAASLASSVSRPRMPVYTYPPYGNHPEFRMTWEGIKSIYLIKAVRGVLANPEELDTIDITGNKVIPIANEMQALLNAFKSDRRDIRTMVEAIRCLAGIVKEEASQFEDALTIPTDRANQNTTQKQMAFLTSGDPLGKSILKAIGPSQLALNRMAKTVYRRRKSTDKSYLPSRTRIFWRERAFLMSMLNQPQYNGLNGENVRVITAGIPRGMVEALSASPYILGSDKPTVDVAVQRVVEISVYRRDLEFESVVFKPKKFLFDPFIFISPWVAWDGMSTNPRETFRAKYQTRLRYSRLHDVHHRDPAKPPEGRWERMGSQRELYPFFTDEEFKSMFYNHATSCGFSLYYKLLFGLDIDAFGFFANENYNEIFFDNNVKKILSAIAQSDELKKLIPLGTAPWQSLVDLTNDNMNRVKNFDEITSMLVPSVEDIMIPGGSVPDQVPPQITSEQMKHFRAVLSSKIFSPVSMATQITAPRLLERVFMLPIDPDDFFIDEVQTLRSLAGDESMKKRFMVKNVEEITTANGVEKRLKVRRARGGQYEFSDFFIQIALVDVGGK
jgi:hypothetical protein